MNPASGVFIGYLGRQFVLRFIGLLIFFVILLQMLDMLNKSSDILEVDGAGLEQLLRYISLRAPQIASQFTPFAALLAIVLTLAGLSHTSEITVMRAAGMSIHRVLYPLGFACGLIAIAHFAFHEIVVVPNSDKLEYWEANDFAIDLPPEGDTRTDVRIKSGNELIEAESAARYDDTVILSGVTIYELDEENLARQLIRARAARYADGAWRLYNVKIFDAVSLAVDERPDVIWTSELAPELLFALSVKPDQTSLGELSRKIGQLKDDRADTRSAMTSMLGRFSKPLATLVMPLLGAIAGFGVHRQGVLLARAVSGAALGFAYFVAENMALALGKLGVVPAVIGAFFPLALFLVVGFSIVLLIEN